MDRTFSREEILSRHPLLDECERAGLQFKKQGAELYAKCPFHTDGGRPNFRVNVDKGLWNCDVCGFGGGVVEFVAKLSGRPTGDVFKTWAQEMDPEPLKPHGGNGAPSGSIVATYDYRNEAGDLVFQVCRMEPKTFRQRHMVSGKWVWSMEGVTRVLYRLPEVLNAAEVWIVEGEKDADNLTALGFCATCNVGGAGKWLDGYTDSLKGRDVVLCGDNDEPGRQHMDKVLLAIKDVCKSVKLVRVPSPHKDVSDYIKAADDGSDLATDIRAWAEAAPVVGGLYLMPVRSIFELEEEYCEYAKKATTLGLDLGRWLPSLGLAVRPLVPGEVAVFLADTGTGKTAILQNLALSAGITTLLFELELPGTLTFERFVALATAQPCSRIEEAYRHAQPGQTKFAKLRHIWTCTKSGLSIADMRKLIHASELKIGSKPALVMVDYVQLVAGEGKNRYERTSSVAEQLKVLAKETGTIIVAASQVGRKDYSEGAEIGLHDGKNAGEIENSSGLVVGAWRAEGDSATLILKVLKNTKGRAGKTVVCNFDGETMTIKERSPISDDDVPKT